MLSVYVDEEKNEEQNKNKDKTSDINHQNPILSIVALIPRSC